MTHNQTPWVISRTPKFDGYPFALLNQAGDAELGNWLIAGVRWEDDAKFIIEACNSHASNMALIAELVEALDQAEACMSIVEPRSDTKEYVRILGVIRAALERAKSQSPASVGTSDGGRFDCQIEEGKS